MAKHKVRDGFCTVCREFSPELTVSEKDGKSRCPCCEAFRKKYEEHWFVRSLQWKKPSLTPIRRKKPLPGQQDLFEHGPLDSM